MSVPCADYKTTSLAERNNSQAASGFVSSDDLASRPRSDTIQTVSTGGAATDVAPSTKTHQVTGFIDDSTSMEVSLPKITTPDRKIIADSLESRIHTIVDVLTRPVVVASLEWSPSQIRETQLLELDFPQALFAASSNIVDKLQYFAFLRADVVIRVMVNANTFQQGKLLGYFTPFDKVIGDRATASNFLTSKTAFPYIISDASVGNTADIVIPYVAPYSSYRLVDQIGNIGTFFLTVLNPLTLMNATVTVQAWFANVSVDLPSGVRNDLTDSTRVLNEIKALFDKDDDDVKMIKKLDRVVTRYKAQVAGSEAEQKSGKGVVSSTLHTVSKIGEVAANIPMIAPVALPVSWVSKALAQVAEYFGFCKSTDLSSVKKFAQIPAFGFTNAGGLDSGLVLGSSPENSIEHRGDLFGSKVDDMNITYVVSHRCYVDSFTYSTNQNPGTLLYRFPVTPGWCNYNVAQACFEPTLTAYVASMFNLWRGGLRYKIQAAKTAYHSGRIRITYVPATSGSSADPDQAYNWVFDLRNQSEMEFTIPYNNIIEWQKCGLTDSTESSFSIGTVRITVYNVLRRPESVADNVEFNIWVAGDKNLQFAVPTFQRYVPSKPSASITETGQYISRYAMRKKRDTKRGLLYKAQVLGTAQDMGFNDMAHKPAMFGTSHNDRVSPCKYAIGEYVSNLRYLTRRFDEEASFPLTQNSAFTLPNYYFGDLFDPLEDDPLTYRMPPVNYISYIYRFFRGGMRWKAMYNGPVVTGGYQEMTLGHGIPSSREPASTAIALYDRIAKGTSSFRHRIYNTINLICEVTAPFFSNTPIRAITGVDVIQPALLDDSQVFYRFSGYTSQSGTSVDFLKAAADDFSFGWIVGPPRLRPREGQLLQLNFSAVTSVSYFENSTEGNWIYNIRGVTTNGTISDGIYNIVISDTATIPAIFLDLSTTNTDTLSFTVEVVDDEIFQLNSQNAVTPTGEFDEPNTIAQLALIGPTSNGLVTVDLILK